jgi:hypothetical protein
MNKNIIKFKTIILIIKHSFTITYQINKIIIIYVQLHKYKLKHTYTKKYPHTNTYIYT